MAILRLIMQQRLVGERHLKLVLETQCGLL